MSTLRVTGLKTSNNPLTSGEGALRLADNCVIKFKDQIDPRRGQQLQNTSLGNSYSTANVLFFYNNNLFAQHDKALAKLSAGTFSDYTGTFAAPANSLGIRMKAIEAQQDLFFSSSAGIQFVDSSLGTPVPAGAPRPLDINPLNVTLNTGTGQWMTANGVSAYKVVYGKRDASNRVVLGPPSGRLLVTNPNGGATSFVTLQSIQQPTTVNASNFFRLYRTAESVTATTDPGDNYYLVYEGPCANPLTVPIGSMSGANGVKTVTVNFPGHGYDLIPSTQPIYLQVITSDSNFDTTNNIANLPTFGPISIVNANQFTYQQNHSFTGNPVNAATVTIVPGFAINDYTPDSLPGPPLYTNPLDGDGSLAGVSDNAQPPLCLDLASFNFRNWYSNTTSKQRIQIQLLGVGSPAGLQNLDTITIGGTTYTALNTVTIANGFGFGGGTPAQTVQGTALNLIGVINANAPATGIFAYYVSSANGAPGLIQLEEVGIGGSAFTVYASRNTAWAPALTSSSTNALSSTNDAAPNRLFYSKPYQPEAVPLLNYLDCGSRFKNILRILPLRDKLYVFKEDGIYVVSGAGSYQVTLLDSTARLIAPETAVAFNNQIFALTNQGVVSVSELGVRVMSQSIEDLLLPLTTTGNTLKTYGFGVAYESERSYLLAVPTVGGDTSATQVFVYNYVTDAWTRWPIPRTCGVVDPIQDVLYMGTPLHNDVYKENKTLTAQDNYDEGYSAAVMFSGPAGVVTIAQSTAFPAPAPGDRISGITSAGVPLWARVTSVMQVAAGEYQLTFDNAADNFYSSGVTNITVYKAIPCEVQWQYGLPGEPGLSKQFKAFTLHFRRLGCHLAYGESFTETDPALQTSTITAGLGWGDCVFGTTTTILPSTPQANIATRWGNPSGPINRRILIPARKHFGTYLTVGFQVQEAMGDWSLNGVTLEADGVSERTTGSPGST